MHTLSTLCRLDSNFRLWMPVPAKVIKMTIPNVKTLTIARHQEQFWIYGLDNDRQDSRDQR